MAGTCLRVERFQGPTFASVRTDKAGKGEYGEKQADENAALPIAPRRFGLANPPHPACGHPLPQWGRGTGRGGGSWLRDVSCGCGAEDGLKETGWSADLQSAYDTPMLLWHDRRPISTALLFFAWFKPAKCRRSGFSESLGTRGIMRSLKWGWSGVRLS